MASLQYDGFPARSPSGVVSPRRPRSRTQSISSDRPSTVGHGFVSIPVSVSPQPAFIAASAASQIVTNDHDSHADTWYDESGMIPAGETAIVSNPALQLVNSFLDQLLFNFLQLSKATTLSALRPAVTEVLKPKLAKDAINNADEELQEYLGGADEEDYVLPQGADPSRDWDLELVWKRTRLRCMVYSSLGDMEEEDEDIYMEQENLEIGADEQISDVISPAVAIFLTSVLEYMGELTLTVAGQAAYHRVRANFEKELKDGSRTMADIADRIVVEEGDMERVALDRTLGRLWRGWKKRIRVPSTLELGLRSFSRASVTRQDSNTTEAFGHQSPVAIEEATNDVEGEAADGAVKVEEKPQKPAEIPLPIGQNDVNEIEVPGLAYHSDDEAEEEDADVGPARPKSLLIRKLPQGVVRAPVAGTSQGLGHKRSTSLPASPPSKFTLPPVSQQLDEVSSDDASSNYEDRIEEPVSDLSTPAAEHDESEATQVPSQEYRKKSTMMIANTAFGPLVKKQEQRPAQQEEDEMTTTYEKAEIMTSSRVSVASSSPSIPEAVVNRTASVRSARIVDVPGPRSPHSSRSPSMDATERVRSTSLNRGNGGSTPPIAEESEKAKQTETTPRANGASVPASTSTQAQMSARITGFDDDEPDPVVLAEDIDPRLNYTASSPQAEGGVRSNNRHAPYAQPARIPPSSSRQQSLPPSTKISIHTGHYSNGFIDEPIPEVPTRAAGHSSRQVPRSNSIGKASLEQLQFEMKESDLVAPPPLGQPNAPSRPIHTSGSSTSSATARHKAVRTSEEHVPSHAESVARNFEELIHSDQTITYTLTPENMRDMDVSDHLTTGAGQAVKTDSMQSPRSAESPKSSRFSRGKTEESHSQERSRSSSNTTDFKNVSSSQRSSSNLPQDKRGQRPAPIAVPGSGTSSISKSYGGSEGPKSPKVPAALARDARVPADSTADMAQFLKATGPAGENRPPPVRSAHTANAPSVQKISSDSHRPSASNGRNRYQPRDAAADAAGDSKDLADFIRQGPPPNGLRMNRPIPSAVDMAIPEVRHSQASTNATEYSGPSMQSSVNSNTALLKNKGPSLPKMMGEEDMMPKRKTRRVKDPYAIDFSDEEDEELFASVTPQPPPKKEESLAEFLRNYAPPPEPQVQPISQKIPKKKSSAPSLMNRFTRSRDNKDAKAGKSLKNGLKGSFANGESRSLNSRTGSVTGASKGGHIPIQVSMPPGYNEYGLVDSPSSGQPHVSSGLGAGPTRRVPMKKFEPRDATPNLGRSGTADLAAFLRDSEPPPSSMMTPAVTSPSHTSAESSSFSRFVRRKKPIV